MLDSQDEEIGGMERTTSGANIRATAIRNNFKKSGSGLYNNSRAASNESIMHLSGKDKSSQRNLYAAEGKGPVHDSSEF